MSRERRGHPPRLSWAMATAAYLLATDYTRSTRESYRGQLDRAGRQLGKMPLEQLTAEDLAYRAAVMGGRRGTKSQALTVARVFLVWAAERGLEAATRGRGGVTQRREVRARNGRLGAWARPPCRRP